jgi:CHASE2 domain-containing sensor protein
VRTFRGSLPSGAEPAFWIDHSADWRRLPRVSWTDLAARVESEPGAFRGRLVLVGADFSASGDELHRVPARGAGPATVSGVVLQALMVNTLLAGAPVREVGLLPMLVGAAVAAAFILAGLLCRPRPLWPFVLASAGVLGYAGLSFVLFERSRLLLPIVAPLVVVSLAVSLGFVLRLRLTAIPPAESEAP